MLNLFGLEQALNMNYLNDFNRGMNIDEYKQLLGDQLTVHDLHYKKVMIDDKTNLSDNLKILVITEPWCGDSTAILPVLQKLFEKTNVKIRILRRDDNLELIDQFLTKGGRAIPIILILNDAGEYLGHFGPRPTEAQNIFNEHRDAIQKGDIEKSEVIRKIRTFYAKDKGQAILSDFRRILNEAGSGEKE